MRTINQLVNEALVRWAKLVGVDPTKRMKSLGSWRLEEYLKSLNESRELDPSGLTTFMMLRGLTDELLKDTQFSALQLLTATDVVAANLRPLKHLLDLVESPEVVELIDGFQEQLRGAAKAYGMPEDKKEEFEKLLQSKHALAFVRRDALLSMKHLDHHQFLQGETEEAELKQNNKVYEFWNINSAVAAAFHQKVSGVSLALIRDPEVQLASYFCFLIRNGNTITVLTDRVEGPHPAYNRMSRRPDRNLEDRAAKNWFPYQLMDLKPHEDGKGYTQVRTGIVRLNTEAWPMAKIGELFPEQFVWVTLMFDLIREEYGRQKKLLPEVSYTGEMVVEPHVLVGPGSAIIKAGQYQPLALAPLTKPDITLEKTAAQWERPSTKHNTWMEERYGERVPDEYLNPVGDQAKHLLESGAGRVSKVLAPKKDTWEKSKLVHQVKLEALSAVTFGSKEKLEKDRAWVARTNKMKMIQGLAEEEFERERGNMAKWWHDAVEKNAEFLLDAAARGELKGPVYSTRNPKVTFDHGFEEFKKGNLLYKQHGKKWGYMTWPSTSSGDVLLGTYSPDAPHYRCYETGQAASVFTVFRPTCAASLAFMAGLTLEDLPWAMRHWTNEAPYSGNSILDRIEPSDWALNNPWQEHMKWYVFIATSKSAFNARRKKLGLPRKDVKDPEKYE